MNENKPVNAGEKGEPPKIFQATDSESGGPLGVSPQTSPSTSGKWPNVNNLIEYDEMDRLRQEIMGLRIKLFQMIELKVTHQDGEFPNKLLMDALTERRNTINDFRLAREEIKEARLDLVKMEKMHAENQAKSDALLNKVNFALRALEEKWHSEKSELMQELTEKNAQEDLQSMKINELQAAVNNAEEKVRGLESTIAISDSCSAQCNEAIKKHDANIIPAVLRENSNIMEVIETRLGQIEKSLKNLGKDYAVLCLKNEEFVLKLKETQDLLCSEISDFKTKELKMREQSKNIETAQASLTMDIGTTARLLKRIEDYEYVYEQLIRENGNAKRENELLQATIEKLKLENVKRDDSNDFHGEKGKANGATKIDETLMVNQDRGDYRRELIHRPKGPGQHIEELNAGVAFTDEWRDREKREDRPYSYWRPEYRKNYTDEREKAADSCKEYASETVNHEKYIENCGLGGNERKESTDECTHREEVIYELGNRASRRCFLGKLPETEREEVGDKLDDSTSTSDSDSREFHVRESYKKRGERSHNRGEAKEYAYEIDAGKDYIHEHGHKNQKQNRLDTECNINDRDLYDESVNNIHDINHKGPNGGGKCNTEMSEEYIDRSGDYKGNIHHHPDRISKGRVYTNKPRHKHIPKNPKREKCVKQLAKIDVCIFESHDEEGFYYDDTQSDGENFCKREECLHCNNKFCKSVYKIDDQFGFDKSPMEERMKGHNYCEHCADVPEELEEYMDELESCSCIRKTHGEYFENPRERHEHFAERERHIQNENSRNRKGLVKTYYHHCHYDSGSDSEKMHHKEQYYESRWHKRDGWSSAPSDLNFL